MINNLIRYQFPRSPTLAYAQARAAVEIPPAFVCISSGSPQSYLAALFVCRRDPYSARTGTIACQTVFLLRSIVMIPIALHDRNTVLDAAQALRG